MDRRTEMLAAHAALEAAAKRLRETTKRCYPIGRTVAVTLGRARVVGEIIGYGADWCVDRADQVIIKNVTTGKQRHFDAADPHNYYQPQLLQT